MKKMPVKLTFLVFLIALLSGFYLRLPLMENMIRAFVIYLIFSVLILLIYLVHNQSTYNMLKAEIEKENNSAQNNS